FARRRWSMASADRTGCFQPRPASWGKRAQPLGHSFSRQPRKTGRFGEALRRVFLRKCSSTCRIGNGCSRRSRLVRRDSRGNRGAFESFTRRSDGHGSELALCRKRDIGNQDFWSAFSLAELGVHTPELHRRAWRAEIVWHRLESQI